MSSCTPIVEEDMDCILSPDDLHKDPNKVFMVFAAAISAEYLKLAKH